MWRQAVVGALFAVAISHAANAQESAWNHPWTCGQYLAAYTENIPSNTEDAVFGPLYPFTFFIYSFWEELDAEAQRHRLRALRPNYAEGLEYLAQIAGYCRQNVPKKLKEVVFMFYQEDRASNGLPLLQGCTLNRPGVVCNIRDRPKYRSQPPSWFSRFWAKLRLKLLN